MRAQRNFSRLATLLTLALIVFTASCSKSCGTKKPPLADVGIVQGQGTPPSIDTPEPTKRIIAKVDPSALPENARGQFPAYDGDPFFISLPAQPQGSVSAQEVSDKFIAPILKAVGFERGPKALSMPPDQGVKQPVADFKGTAQTVAYEYDANPKMRRPRTQQMIDAFLGKTQADDNINIALQTGEGMNFAQFVANIERLAIDFPFQQIEGDVPIEHTHIKASRWDGQGITTISGVLFNNYAVANQRRIDPREVVQSAVRSLSAVKGIERVVSERPVDGPTLVLLPYGTDGSGVTQMRYAYRMILNAVVFKQEGPFLLWVDADNGNILKLDPLLKDAVGAVGMTYNRDPNVGTLATSFEVDSSAGGQYTLQLAGVFTRVDFQGDGFNATDVSISDMAGGSSATFANFNQAPINDAAQALCSSGTNKGFEQVNFAATIYRGHRFVMANGIFTPFPSSPWDPRVHSAFCNGNASMNFGVCPGYFNAGCPDASDGTNSTNNMLSTSQDNTWIGHELGHNVTQRLTNARPLDWCGMPGCEIPVGWSRFHDLADFWSAQLESTNCWSGWFSKNSMGTNASLNCAQSDEGGWSPRISQVTTPFNPGAAGDHFPEHRAIASGVYAEMQMGTAALWEARLGMRSKCRPSGLPQFSVRYQRALKETGFLGLLPPATDTGLYRMLYDLEQKMTDQWATSGSPTGPPAFAHNGPHTTNKVTAGFARTGLFLIPYQCLDGDVGTPDATFCPTGENGGDAVIDIDDNEPGDDLTINGVVHRETDFLRLGGPAPTFLVWTGPRYRLNGGGGASTLTNPSPCNTKFMVEVSTDPAFPGGSTISSGWINVDVDPTTAISPEGFGTWSPDAAQWTTLQAGGAGTRLYYRARTRDAADANDRNSLQPGNGLWTVPPPYAVITPTGQSDY